MIAPRITRMVKHGIRRPKVGADPGHLACVRQLHCCVCYAHPPSDPDHLMSVDGEGVKGIARKHKDRFTVPLCRLDHTGRGNDCAQFSPLGHEAWLASKGIDGRALADALHAVTGDLPAMHRVNFANYQRACLRMKETPA